MATKKHTRARSPGGAKKPRPYPYNFASALDHFSVSDVDLLLRRLRRAPAVMTDEQLLSVEKMLTTGNDGIARRMAFAVLKNPGRQLLDIKDRETALALADAERVITETVPRMQAIVEWMNEASARLLLALATRKDFHELHAEVRKEGCDPAAPSATPRLVVDNTREVTP